MSGPDFVTDFLLSTQRLMQGDPVGRSFQDLANRRWLMAGMANPSPLPVPGPTPGGYSLPGVDGNQVWNALAIPSDYYPAYRVVTVDGVEGLLVADWTLAPGNLYTNTAAQNAPPKYMHGGGEAIITPLAPEPEQIHASTPAEYNSNSTTETPVNIDEETSADDSYPNPYPNPIPYPWPDDWRFFGPIPWKSTEKSWHIEQSGGMSRTTTGSGDSHTTGFKFVPKGTPTDGVQVTVSNYNATGTVSTVVSHDDEVEDGYSYNRGYVIGGIGNSHKNGAISTMSSTGETNTLTTSYSVNGTDGGKETLSTSSSDAKTYSEVYSFSDSTVGIYPQTYSSTSSDEKTQTDIIQETITGRQQYVHFYPHKWCDKDAQGNTLYNAKTTLLAARYITHRAYSRTTTSTTTDGGTPVVTDVIVNDGDYANECECIIFKWEDGSKTASRTYPDSRVNGMEIEGMCLVYLK